MNRTNCTVSLERFNSTKISLPKEITNDRGSVTLLNSKDTIEFDETTKVKRSARLSKKRKCLYKSVSEDGVHDNYNKRKMITKNLNLNEIKSRKSVYTWNCPKKTNGRIFERSTRFITKNNDLPEVAKNVEPSPSPNKDIEANAFLNGSSKNLKNKKCSKSMSYTKKMTKVLKSKANGSSDDVEVSDFFVYNRKRGRPPARKTPPKKLLKLDDASGKDQQKTKSLDAIVEQIHNTNGSTLSETPGGNVATEETIRDDEEPLKAKKKSSVGKSSAKTHSHNGTVRTTTAPNASAETPLDANAGPELGTLGSELSLLSNRFNVPFESLRQMVAGETLSLFREKYSESIVPSMLTVSPIVSFDERSDTDGAGKHVEYKIEPIRRSRVYEKANLKDLMAELSETMPSWSLCIVHDPPRYVISHMSINDFGTPFVNKSVVLDSYFRASVYINQCLEYKYCKRYKTATEIVNLIVELNDV